MSGAEQAIVANPHARVTLPAACLGMLMLGANGTAIMAALPTMRSDLQLWGVDKIDAYTMTIVGQIVCTDSGRLPVQREFNRRMKLQFEQLGIEIASAQQTILLHQPLAKIQENLEGEEDNAQPGGLFHAKKFPMLRNLS